MCHLKVKDPSSDGEILGVGIRSYQLAMMYYRLFVAASIHRITDRREINEILITKLEKGRPRLTFCLGVKGV